jgi:uncharacterized protein YjbI with pentapeptide repeats
MGNKEKTADWSGCSDHLPFIKHWAEYHDREQAAKEVSAYTSQLIDSTGKGLMLADVDLSGYNLAGFDLRRATLNRTRLHGADFTEANLSWATLICPAMERTRLHRANLRHAYVHALAVQASDLSHCDLSHLVDATGALFHGCDMSHARFDSSVLNGSLFYQCNLAHSTWVCAGLQGSTINECYLDNADLTHALVAQLTITKSHITECSLCEVTGDGMVIQRPTACDGFRLNNSRVPYLRLEGARGRKISAYGLYAPYGDFHDNHLPGINLSTANLEGSRWSKCNLDNANLQACKLKAALINECCANNADLTNVIGENLTVLESSLVDAQMKHFAGRCVTFRDCDLTGAVLSGAYLYRAMITGDPPRAMSLVRARLDAANLIQSYLAADLSGADLRNAQGAYARLNQCCLSQADLSGVNIFQASLVKTDFTGATIRELDPPFFVDRCKGLLEALEQGPQTSRIVSLGHFVRQLQLLLATVNKGST